MRIVARYSFNNGEAEVAARYAAWLAEIEEVVQAIDAKSHRTKQSKEKTKQFRMLYNLKSPGLPRCLQPRRGGSQ